MIISTAVIAVRTPSVLLAEQPSPKIGSEKTYVNGVYSWYSAELIAGKVMGIDATHVIEQPSRKSARTLLSQKKRLPISGWPVKPARLH